MKKKRKFDIQFKIFIFFMPEVLKSFLVYIVKHFWVIPQNSYFTVYRKML